ncbi:MAG: glycosyltransferase family 39 protein [Planctomycetes bacterium]|nr:glycosyltransferase family 39 protein [Planctomycetota bacterium]
MEPSRERRWLITILLAAATTFGFRLDHGLSDLVVDRSIDALHPATTMAPFEPGPHGWSLSALRYPALLFRVVGAAQCAWMFVVHGPDSIDALYADLDRRAEEVWRSEVDLAQRDAVGERVSELILVGRAVVAAFGLLLVYALWRWVRSVFGVEAATIAAATCSCTPVVVHYVKQLNTDVPYLALAMLGLAFVNEAIASGAAKRLLAGALCAGLAVGTKDQAYGLFVGFAPIALWAFARPGELSEGRKRRLPGRTIALAIVVGVIPVLLLPGVPFDADWFRAHVAFLRGNGSVPFRQVDASFAGIVHLAGMVGRFVVDGVGWPCAVCGGIAAIALARSRPRAVVLIVAPSLAYFASFLAPIGYVMLRFTLPMQLAAIALTGGGIDALARRGWTRSAAVCAVLVLGSNAWSTVGEFGVLAATDSRVAAERFVRERYRPEHAIVASLSMNGADLLLPSWPRVEALSPDATRRRAPPAPDVLILSWFLSDMPRDRASFSVESDANVDYLGARFVRAREFVPPVRHPIVLGAAVHPVIVVYERVGAFPLVSR